MSMKDRFIKKRRSYLIFFFLTAFAVLSFFPRLTLAASKPTAKQLKVSCRGFQYDNDTAKLYLKLNLKNTGFFFCCIIKCRSLTLRSIQAVYDYQNGTVRNVASVGQEYFSCQCGFIDRKFSEHYNGIYMISGSKDQKVVRACTIRLLNLGPAKHEKVAIYVVNQRISNV